MTENTTVGPLDDGDDDNFTVTPHETYGHLDDVVGGSDETQTVALPKPVPLNIDQYPY